MADYRTQPRHNNDSALARIRMERGLTQDQLADQIGCRQKDISRWESGTMPGAGYLIKIALAPGFRIEDILA